MVKVYVAVKTVIRAVVITVIKKKFKKIYTFNDNDYQFQYLGGEL